MCSLADQTSELEKVWLECLRFPFICSISLFRTLQSRHTYDSSGRRAAATAWTPAPESAGVLLIGTSVSISTSQPVSRSPLHSPSFHLFTADLQQQQQQFSIHPRRQHQRTTRDARSREINRRHHRGIHGIAQHTVGSNFSTSASRPLLRTCMPIRILGGSFCTPPYWVCDASHAGSRMLVFPLLLPLNILYKIYPYRYYNSY